jgi:hypothetical protein
MGRLRQADVIGGSRGRCQTLAGDRRAALEASTPRAAVVVALRCRGVRWASGREAQVSSRGAVRRFGGSAAAAGEYIELLEHWEGDSRTLRLFSAVGLPLGFGYGVGARTRARAPAPGAEFRRAFVRARAQATAGAAWVCARIAV